jgi:hypothetical protein
MASENPANLSPRPISSSPVQETVGSPAKSKRQVSTETWERPSPSRIWLDVGLTILGIAPSFALVAFTAMGSAASLAPEIWTATAALIFLAGVCLVAHHDVNRGRKPKRSIRVEEVEDLFVTRDKPG